ncbi:tRNA-uridine aminocarboxypropyltransferase [soil metagenome]
MTRPVLDRQVPRKPRCDACRLMQSHCMCDLQSSVATRSAICLLMAEFEPLKPSNTGWLVADVVPDTSAFTWSRTSVDPALVALLADPLRQPYVVFPAEFSDAARVLHDLDSSDAQIRPPLFVLLDGTWSEARKMFRKSPYLAHLPVLSLHPGQLSRYRLRRSSRDHHFCTSEVAALCLATAGDDLAAQTLETWLDLFSDRYLRAKQSVPP